MLQHRLKTVKLLNHHKLMTTIKQTLATIVALISLAAIAAMAQTNQPVSNPTNSPPQTNAPPPDNSGDSGDITDPSLGPVIPGNDLVPIVFIVPAQVPAAQIQTSVLSMAPSFVLPKSLTTTVLPSVTSPPSNRKPSSGIPPPSMSQ
jgi:hypothetical protein